ncbi:polyketide synthase dehydratase domain-containing protein, partial [Streptomyces sp. Amel2xB2]|uniref:polyketide synthase dehydratase domain-containing protein n=1 Tax=Streptomyces sp. Amel2xB2 TaxID=1305829 RepID=UPI0015EB682B
RAGDEVGCDRVEDLTMAAPLVVPEQGGVQIQLRVGTADSAGRRTVSIHGRTSGTDDLPWTEHASGTLGTGTEATEFDTSVWPPADAHPVELADCYERFAEAGFRYGTVFQGLTAAWRGKDGELFAEVALPEEARTQGFGLHPALLDGALHALLLQDGDQAAVPFSWEGVTLYATGASAIRVRLIRGSDDAIAVALTDTLGAPVAAIESLITRRIQTEQLAGAYSASRDALFGMSWTPVPIPSEENTDLPSVGVVGADPFGLAACVSGAGSWTALADVAGLAAVEGSSVPGVVLVPVPGGVDGGVAGAAHAVTSHVLGLVQLWLDDARFMDSRLVFVTRGAVSGVDPAA